MSAERMRRNSIWRRIIPAAILLVIVRYIWMWITDLPKGDNQMEFVRQDGIQQTFKGSSCVMKNGKCIPENLVHAPSKGLYPDGSEFYLDGRPFRILSGSFHYFRTQPAQWGDRLERMKAAGLNTVTTYIPWNLHEKKRGEVNFSGQFDLASFIQHVKSSGLKLIIRPGPYICSEWEFGGLPSWLLNDPHMIVRTSKYKPYLDRVEEYFSKLLPMLATYQYSKGNGPIIAFQVENEYGSYGRDLEYMQFLKDLFDKWGIGELLFTSDGGKQLVDGTLPGVFETVNFQNNVNKNLQLLGSHQPGKPKMVAEFWDGWFDHWGEQHHTMSTAKFQDLVTSILKQGASINFYMFVGGTNFGFWNGANNQSVYAPTITSYDYDAPISECGDFTKKAHTLRNILTELSLAPVDFPQVPTNPAKMAYGKVQIETVIGWDEMVGLIKEKKPNLKDIVPMEFLEINNNGGQGYGYIIYRNTLQSGGTLEIRGNVSDRAQILLDFNEIDVIDWSRVDNYVNRKVIIPLSTHPVILDIFVENLGRVNYGGQNRLNIQRKGIIGDIFLDGKKLENWIHVPLEFCDHYYEHLQKSTLWKPFKPLTMPAVYRGFFNIPSEPKDTFLRLKGWKKGIVFINGHNLGRYWEIGPQQTLYVPAPILTEGKNEIIIFNQYKPAVDHVEFIDHPILG